MNHKLTTGHWPLTTFFALTALLACCLGCTPESKPTPRPGPQPPGAAVNVVVIVDPATETPEQARVYCDATLRSYCEKSGHGLRIVDARQQSAGYLLPYYEAAAKLKTKPPTVVIGRAKKILLAAALPNGSQLLIDLVEHSTVGDADRNSVWAGGARRALGCLPMRPGAERRWRVEGSTEAEPLIPRSKWVDVDFSHLAAPTIDQDGYSCCCACSSVQALVTGKTRAGLRYEELSVVDCYSRGNGGHDSGMALEDGMRILLSGVCDTGHAAMWGVSKAKHTGDYQTNRKQSRPLSMTLCPDAEHVGSALQRLRPVVFGTMVDSDFKPDANGLIGPKKGPGRGGHALYLVGARKIGGQWYFLVCNSWGLDWGLDGRAWIHESWIDPAFGAWAIATVAQPDDEPLPAAKESGSSDWGSDCPLPAAYYPLPPAFSPPPTVHFPLPTDHCLRLAA